MALEKIESVVVSAECPEKKSFLSISLIEAISSTLKTVNPQKVKIHSAILNVPLYTKTLLEGHGVLQSQTVILRKNVYFLAKKTINVTEFIDELVRTGLLSGDDRDKLLMTLEDETMKALMCYILVIQRDHSQYGELLHALEFTNNTEVVSILKDHENEMRYEEPQPSSSTGSQKETGLLLPTLPICQLELADGVATLYDHWSCKRCTYWNDFISENCEACSSVKNADPKEEEGSHECPQCTLVNFAEVTDCEACGFKLNNDESEDAIEVEPTIDISDSNDDND